MNWLRFLREVAEDAASILLIGSIVVLWLALFAALAVQACP